ELQMPVVEAGVFSWLPVNKEALLNLGVSAGTPAAVTDLVLTPGLGSISGSWTDGDEGDSPITGHGGQYRKSTDTDWTPITGLTTATSFAPITGLDAVPYVVEVWAINA